MDRATAAAVLGVRPEADGAEVEAAFRVLAGLTHPDRFPEGSASWEDANRGMQGLLEARRTMAETPVAEAVEPAAWTVSGEPVESVPSWERSDVGPGDPVAIDRRMRTRAFSWGAVLLASAGMSLAVGATQPVNDALPFWAPALAVCGLLSIATGWRSHRRLVALERRS
ncbi:hypothetical protein [Longivirga aurantiaca]|uniref:J domain-containing protein n=1 Tax=Longivirga aurantiaca TaxID=1837743 RepID=A0ABW1T692_9ACTN